MSEAYRKYSPYFMQALPCNSFVCQHVSLNACLNFAHFVSSIIARVSDVHQTPLFFRRCRLIETSAPTSAAVLVANGSNSELVCSCYIASSMKVNHPVPVCLTDLYASLLTCLPCVDAHANAHTHKAPSFAARTPQSQDRRVIAANKSDEAGKTIMKVGKIYPINPLPRYGRIIAKYIGFALTVLGGVTLNTRASRGLCFIAVFIIFPLSCQYNPSTVSVTFMQSGQLTMIMYALAH